MSEHLISPEKSIVIDGKTYVLRGEMGVLKAIQHHFDEDIYDIASKGILSKRFDALARIVAFGIGRDAPEIEAIERDIVQVRGMDETKYLLMEWLVASVSPKGEREKNVARLLEQVEAIRAATAAVKQSGSRGKSTKNSA